MEWCIWKVLSLNCLSTKLTPIQQIEIPFAAYMLFSIISSSCSDMNAPMYLPDCCECIQRSIQFEKIH